MSWWKNAKRTAFSLRGSTLSLAGSPLWLAAIIGLFQGRFFKTASALASAISISAAARLTKRYFSRTAYILPTEDQRQTAMLLTALGVGIISAYLLRRPIGIAAAAIFAGAAYYYHYIFGVIAPDPDINIHPLDTAPASKPEPAASAPDLSALNEALQADMRTALQALDTLRRASPDAAPAQARTRAAELHYPLANDPVERYNCKRLTLTDDAYALLCRAVSSESHVRKLRPLLVSIFPEIADTAVKLAASTPNETQLINLTAVLDSAIAAIAQQQTEYEQAQHRELDIKIDVLSQQINATKQQLL